MLLVASVPSCRAAFWHTSLLTAACLRLKVFLQGLCEMDVQQFRNRCVEPMGEESDHLHIRGPHRRAAGDT